MNVLSHRIKSYFSPKEGDMEFDYHFLEPGEEIALVRLAKRGARLHKIPIVFTMRQRDVLRLLREIDLQAIYADYDGTFTRIGTMWKHSKKRNPRTFLTTWQEVRSLMPSAGQQALQRHYELYKRGDITPMEWLYITIAAYHEHDVKLEDVIRVTSEIPFRVGQRELLSFTHANIPRRVIVSFGMRDVIRARRELGGWDVFASDLQTDETGHIVGVLAGVTEETKGLAVVQDRQRHGIDKMASVSMGNSFHDRHLFAETGFSIYLSHGGYKGVQIDYAAEIEQLKSIATAIVFDDTLYPVTHLLRCIQAKRLL